MRGRVVGVMGPGAGATAADCELAGALGRAIASEGWAVLTGGRPSGVMAAVNRGAKQAGGLTIGILPGRDRTLADPNVEVVINTDLGYGRNNINVLSSDAIVACGMGLGTASEVALALKNGKSVILLGCNPTAIAFFQQYGGVQLKIAATVDDAIRELQTLLMPPQDPPDSSP
ncbi:hypothetical protein PN441_05965 [Spirulina major CS-329]|uniref:SLOG cluster 4 domain-containing protein n=1 Tax=Spirulina TaxID=1154 RepID=UPI00232C2ED3|nr:MULTISPECIES: hypothetical protein [Spirulina]MDB9495008.1 hypothetical protein [Spirulina subsalsa CS-330]MDB9502613.1 hypothetical protein [Spirulina major CS-329]